MTTKVEDWCGIEEVQRSLRIPHADSGELARYIAEAVAWIAGNLALPLLERKRDMPGRITRAGGREYPASIAYADVPWPLPGREVTRVRYWTDKVFDVPPPGEPTDWIAVDEQTPMVGVWRKRDNQSGHTTFLWYPPAPGWPMDATWYSITIREGLKPNEHAALRAAILGVVRSLWMGKTDADTYKLVQQLMQAYAPNKPFVSVAIPVALEDRP